MTEKIKELLQRMPFEAFSIYMSDGREYQVPTPDHAHVYPNNLAVSVYTDTVDFRLPARQISGIGSPMIGA